MPVSETFFKLDMLKHVFHESMNSMHEMVLSYYPKIGLLQQSHIIPVEIQVFQMITKFSNLQLENVSKMEGLIGPRGFNCCQGPTGEQGPRGFNGTRGQHGNIN